jgi:prenyltransferase beta subunit
MSLRLEMLQVARLAPNVLGDSAALVRDFLLSQVNRDGGFKDRTGRSDLYYTVFGLEGLTALQAPLPLTAARGYLESFGEGAGLDFVHLCCLARCWATVRAGDAASVVPGERLREAIEAFRSADGGFHPQRGSAHGTAYAAFLAMGAYQDLGAPLPDADALSASLSGLGTVDGAWTNDRAVPSAPGVARVGSTTATAAAVAVLRALSRSVDPRAGRWLLAQAHPQGGFRATPQTPMPDLLSTAVVLHALAFLQVPIDALKERCLDFVDSLWTNAGAFHGHWGDDHLDVEYTYYGLLALGHLSL